MTHSIARLRLEHFAYASRALGYRDNCSYILRAGSCLETISAIATVFADETNASSSGILDYEMAPVACLVICVDAFACGLLERSDGQALSASTRVQFGLWVVREWLRDNALNLVLRNEDWRGLTNALNAALTLPIGSSRYIGAMDSIAQWFSSRVEPATRMGSYDDDILAFLALPMTVGEGVRQSALIQAEYLRDELARRRVEVWLPVDYFDWRVGERYADDPTSRVLEEKLIPHKDVMIILHPAPATGLGSVADVARAWRLPTIVAHSGGRISPRLVGSPNPPMLVDTRSPDWCTEICAIIDGQRAKVLRDRSRRRRRLAKAATRLEAFRAFLQSLTHKKLSLPWTASVTPDDLRLALASPELFARLTVEEIEEIYASVGEAPPSDVFTSVLSGVLPSLSAREKLVLDNVASNEAWSRRMRLTVELVGRTLKLPTEAGVQRRIRFGSGDLTDAATWIAIARAHE